MAHFGITSDSRELRKEFMNIRKNDYDTAGEVVTGVYVNIEKGRDVSDLHFFIKGKEVSFDEFSAEQARVEDEYRSAYKAEWTYIWVQQGVCHNSGYKKRIRRSKIKHRDNGSCRCSACYASGEAAE